jgi:hypothetical protein
LRQLSVLILGRVSTFPKVHRSARRENRRLSRDEIIGMVGSVVSVPIFKNFFSGVQTAELRSFAPRISLTAENYRENEQTLHASCA